MGVNVQVYTHMHTLIAFGKLLYERGATLLTCKVSRSSKMMRNNAIAQNKYNNLKKVALDLNLILQSRLVVVMHFKSDRKCLLISDDLPRISKQFVYISA